jgi:hypothetical protein
MVVANEFSIPVDEVQTDGLPRTVINEATFIEGAARNRCCLTSARGLKN